MKLLGSLTSPFVRKVRVVLAEKKLDCTFVPEDVWNEDKILKINPLGQVPCLVMEGGEAVFDSRVIVEYLDTLSPVGKLIPPSGRERLEVRIFEALCDGIMEATVKVFLEKNWKGRTDAQRSPAWIERQMGKINAALDMLADRVGERNWCTGQHFSMADVTAGCALDYLVLRCPDLDWRSRHPSLVRLQEKLSQRPSFQATRPPQP
ncbi:glutathione S-transferase family protein [Amphibiibacter pelophylacis]|uniref:Glutathione S-transferase N-terminal domain-containing protein n=1 Tax=Amphibiibacter pelophylacis TaxID=1799477 RepID=A0ACC6NZC5_9BURK